MNHSDVNQNQQGLDQAQPSPDGQQGSSGSRAKKIMIGAGIVVAILAVNAGISTLLVQLQVPDKPRILRKVRKMDVSTIGPKALEKLNISRQQDGDKKLGLVVGPDTNFQGSVEVAKQLRVRGKSKLGKANAKNLVVDGKTLLHGNVVIGKPLTVNSKVDIVGDLSVAGKLMMTLFKVDNLTVSKSLTISTHLKTKGPTPQVETGPAANVASRVSINGNDITGTITLRVRDRNTEKGVVIEVEFNRPYARDPSVVVSTTARDTDGIFVKSNADGFSIGVNNALEPGRYKFDYIVLQ